MRAPRSVSAFVFLGAVLLFSLEPMSGRLLLPRFGGAFHVWTSALMFFQGALVVGYAYAHLVAERIGRLHLGVVGLPLLFLPIGLGDEPSESASVLAILGLLMRHVAVPFVVLSTTSIVAQRWMTSAGKEPFWLYALSNAGSLGALLGYALIVEPFVGLEVQRRAWSVLYVVYVAAALFAWRSAGPKEPPRNVTVSPSERPSTGRLAYWALLSAAPSAFLGAVTNLIALEAGSVPLVWVVPLAIYLGSFVVAFAHDDEGRTRVPGIFRRLWPHMAVVGLFFFTGGSGPGWLPVVLHVLVLAFVSLAAHAELHRTRPAPSELTRFYLVIALGGWAGGAFVALLAPALFPGLYEYPIALALLGLTIALGNRRELRRWLASGARGPLLISAALVLVAVGRMAWGTFAVDSGTTLAVHRSYYGHYRVTRLERADGVMVRDLFSGSTRHGRQREGDRTPLSYYHPEGPLGDALSLFDAPRHIGVVGLGVGAAAAYLNADDRIRFFEIDPVVEKLAREHFTYLEDCPAELDVVIGDARLSLEAESAHDDPYDLLFIDAFAGDAVPTHLLTVEALTVYLSRLRANGVLLFHISNRFYDLGAVLAATAAELRLSGVQIERVTHLASDEDPSRYVALARDPARLEALEHWRPLRPTAASGLWRDDHVNVLEALAF